MSNRYRNRSRSRQKNRHRNSSRSPKRQDSYNQSHKQSSKYQNSQYNRESNKQYKSKEHKQHKKQQQKPAQQTKIICIQDVISANLTQLQRKMTDTSISVGTSVPDQVQIKEDVAYIKYPSIQVSSSIFNFLKGVIYLGGRQKKLKYWPSKRCDINISYDWYCDKCDYKNFARRGKCHRCDNQRNASCRLNYGSQFVSFNTSTKKQQIEDAANCSLMIRGPIVMQIEQEVLLNIFESYAPIKDIRMIRNKVTGGNKDFAFVQFFTPQQAAFALKKATTPDFKISGQKVTVMYSRTKQDDQFYARPYDKDRRNAPPPIIRRQKGSQEAPNYYLRQRQLQIQQQKNRPIITLEQLKQKREQQLKKSLPQQKQMTEQQSQRKKAEMLAKQWQKQIKQQTTIMYICPLCKRKFKNQQQMNNHAKFSELHKYKMAKFQKEILAL